MCHTYRMDFFDARSHGFVRVAAVSMPVVPIQPARNAETISDLLRQADADGVSIAIFPELCITGYAIDDLLMQDVLLDDAKDALSEILEASGDLATVGVVGMPIHHRNRIYNCGVVVHWGSVIAVIPKSYVPGYREFYEPRQIASGEDERGGSIELLGHDVPFGPDILISATDAPGCVLHVEVCEDLWVPISPNTEAALAGATILANLSSSSVTVGKSARRQQMLADASSRLHAAYIYAAAGVGESTTDLSWDGQGLIYEAGNELAAATRFTDDAEIITADIDIDSLRQERLRQGTFDDNRRAFRHRTEQFRTVSIELGDRAIEGLRRPIPRFPFVPSSAELLAHDSYEAFSIQVSALKQRLAAIGQPKIVLGVSGGLDSTQALLVAARAMDELGRPRTDILGFTMPGFATSDHTKSNAWRLGEAFGIAFEEIDIRPAAKQMLADLGHPYASGEDVYDVTFENVQAGLRTDYLFRIANDRGGIVLGTGDLSELALGWCTYGVGDQMSHYGVNAGVPKTLIQHLIRWVIDSEQFDEAARTVLASILDTEISPELVPVRPGDKPQSTQEAIGPYELQDFTLFYTLRYGLRPEKIAFMQWHAWHDRESGIWPPNFPEDDKREYDIAALKAWMKLFYRRFFPSQFKRSALPNGPKVVAGGSLSPRGDWRMPSDVSGSAWLERIDSLIPESGPDSH